jgi:cell filamentation protein
VESRLFPDSVEPDYYPKTNSFVNIINVSDHKTLLKLESEVTFLRSYELLAEPTLIPQTFNFEHLKLIHHHLFKDLYSWAGRPRSYDVRKGTDEFTPANKLMMYENDVFDRSIEFSKMSESVNTENSARKLASCMGIINIYHPFPEGNGRAQRIFMSSLAATQNYCLDWEAVHAWENVEVFKKVHEGNYHPLEDLFLRIIK